MTNDQHRDPQLSRLYDASKDEQPSLQTDAAIRQLAREGLVERRNKSLIQNPSLWAMAASVVLGTTVLLQWPEPLQEEVGLPAELRESVPEAMFRGDTGKPAPTLQMAPPARLPTPLDAEPSMMDVEGDTAREPQLKRKASALPDCDRWVPAQGDDKAAWQRALQHLHESGRREEAACLNKRYVEQFAEQP